MITGRDPAGMTEGERFAEVAEILGKGFVRLLLRGDSFQKDHDNRDHAEPSRDSPATSPKDKRGVA